MKAFISALIAISILFGCCFGVCAEQEELLTNGDLEWGDTTGFDLYGPSNTFTVSKEYARSGSYGACVSARQGKYSTRRQDITREITEWGAGKYSACGWARLSDEGGDCTCLLVINYRIMGESQDRYITSSKLKLTGAWQKFSINAELSYDDEVGLEHIYIYFQVIGTDNTSAPSYCIDDLSLQKQTEKSGIDYLGLTHIDYSGTPRSERTTVGAIRWDAWYGHDGVEQSVISQVERSLSPAEFHYRAPFFSKVTEDGNIEISEYTQEIFDKEMEYAIDAGLDYFAYLMYSTDMQKARNFFKTSALNDKIKMCCIMSPGQKKFYGEILELFQEDYYMTVLDGRPLLYFYVSNTAELASITDDIAWFRTMCARYNIKIPYVAVMTGSTDKITATYADAAAKYAVGGYNGEAYSSLAAKAKKMWYDGKAKTGQVVPNVTFGWQNLPRYKNPVSWTTSNAYSYAQEATEEELYEAVKEAIAFCNEEDNISSTPANTITIYAWNEHDEGGWICPTISVDKDGNQIYNADGTPKINTSHLDALKKAISEYKESTVYLDEDCFCVDSNETASVSGASGAKSAEIFLKATDKAVKGKRIGITAEVVSEITANKPGVYMLAMDIKSVGGVGEGLYAQAVLSDSASGAGSGQGGCINSSIADTAQADIITSVKFILALSGEQLKENDGIWLCQDGAKYDLYIESISLKRLEVGIASAQVKLGAGLSLCANATDVFENTVAPVTGNEARLQMRFTRGGDSVTVEQSADGGFIYDGIAPQYITDNIKLELLYTDNNGTEIIDTVENYSVKQNLINVYSEHSDDETLVTLLSDILEFGAAAQNYLSYNTDKPATANTEWRTASSYSAPEAQISITKNDELNYVFAAGLYCSATNSIYFDVVKENDTVVKIYRDETETAYTIKDGLYYTSDILPYEYSAAYTLKLFKEGESKECYSIIYSVNDYIIRKEADGALACLVRAMSNYGNSCAQYKNK